MQPDFNVLPPVVGSNGYRWVGSTMMTEEQYRIEEWQITAPIGSEPVWEVDHPARGHLVIAYWYATLPGLQRYGRLLAERRGERKAIAQTVRERDDEFREYVDSLDDAKPRFGR